jgi:hypothetical protein
MCDSGACGDFCICDKNLFDVKVIDESIKVGNDSMMMADLWSNLFSAHQALKKFHMISNDDVIISLLKGSSSITFDRIYNTKDGGTLPGIKISVY